MWFVGWVIISCGFMVIKYNNAWWCKIEIWTSVGADSNIGGTPQKGLTRTLHGPPTGWLLATGDQFWLPYGDWFWMPKVVKVVTGGSSLNGAYFCMTLPYMDLHAKW